MALRACYGGAMSKNLLKEVLSVPTCYRTTTLMVRWLQQWLESHHISFYTDRLGNIYATKGVTDTGYFPAVCAHMDTVHKIIPFSVVEEDGLFVAHDTHTGQRTGLGGDDKAGIFVCLELLESQPALKAAFFVDEEIGCLGSREADPAFFENVGYCIEFDSPNNDILSFSCDGMQLCLEDETEDALLTVAQPILTKYGATKWQWHPFTDVAQLRRKFDFECLNLPCGYFNMHSEREFVVIQDAFKAVLLGKELISELGNNFYFMPRGSGYTRPRRLQGTPLILG
jgi:tripeptide aminopeptidase